MEFRQPALPLHLSEYSKTIQEPLRKALLIQGENKQEKIEEIMQRLYKVRGKKKISWDMYVILRYIEHSLIASYYDVVF